MTLQRINKEDIQDALGRMGYPRPGDRIEAVEVNDEYTDIPPGTLGTVNSVDDALTVHVDWDNGRSLGLVPGEDRWRLR